MQAFYTYARRLAEVGPQEHVFEEIRDVGKIMFDFASKGRAVSDCSTLARRMNYNHSEASMNNLIRQAYGPIEFDKERLQ